MKLEGNIAGRGYAEIRIEGPTISRVALIGPEESGRPFLTPGFVDLQLNGFAGVDFSNPLLDPGEACSILPAIWKTGTTSFCPTLITNSQENLLRNFRVLEAARLHDAGFARTVPRYHLEGPYLPPGPAEGVHEAQWMRLPSWNEFARLQEAAGGNIGILTLAPELPGALELIARAHSAGVVVALGHSEATPEQIHAAVEAGARLSTHLGNGCPQLIDRHNNPLWAQLALDQLSATLICDGFHLPPDFVKTVLRTKTIERCILITDATHVATMPPGRYHLLSTEIDLMPNGKVVRADRRSLAGSALSMDRAVAIFMQLSGATLQQALRSATCNPSMLLHHPDTCSKLEVGQPANIVEFVFVSGMLQIKTVWSGGGQVHPFPNKSSQN
jgi:N-acetylglucosamine-6-phosphate deacetylase